MKKLFILCLLALPVMARGEIKKIDYNYQEKIVNAIFLAEGGTKTKYPYGIQSVKTANPRKVCETTVRNTFIRWQQSGQTNGFIEYLGGRYCPVSGDKTGLNKNWVKNVKYFVDKS